MTGGDDCLPYNIIDAPGLGANDRRGTITERHLLKCDVPIVVASFENLSLKLLDEALQQIKANGHRPTVVITKLDAQCDALKNDGGPETLEDTKEEARALFSKAGCSPDDVYLVCANWYTLADEPNIEKVWNTLQQVREALGKSDTSCPLSDHAIREEQRALSGIPAFWAAIDELILRGAAERQASRVCEELAVCLEAVLVALADQDSLLNGARPKVGDKSWQNDVLRVEPEAERILKEATGSMRLECNKACNAAVDEMRHGLTGLLNSLRQMQGSTVEQLSTELQQRHAELEKTLFPHGALDKAAVRCQTSALEPIGKQLAELITNHFPGSVHSLLLTRTLQTRTDLRLPTAPSMPRTAAPDIEQGNTTRQVVSATLGSALPFINILPQLRGAISAACPWGIATVLLPPILNYAIAGVLAYQKETARDLPGEWLDK